MGDLVGPGGIPSLWYLSMSLTHTPCMTTTQDTGSPASWVSFLSSPLLIRHAHRNPQPTGQIAVCRSTGKRWGCSVSTIGVSLMLSTDAPPCSPPGGACGVACSVFPSFPLDERHGIETRAFHRFAVRPPSDHHRCFLSLDVSTPRIPHTHRDPQPTRQIAVCRGTGKR